MNWKDMINKMNSSMPTSPMVEVDNIAMEASMSLSREMDRRLNNLFAGPSIKEPEQIFGEPMPLNDMMASKGRFGDTEMAMVDNKPAHVNPAEKMAIDNFGKAGEEMVKTVGAGTTNPNTGLKEYHNWHSNPQQDYNGQWHVHSGGAFFNEGDGTIYGSSEDDVRSQMEEIGYGSTLPASADIYDYSFAMQNIRDKEYDYVDQIGNLLSDYSVEEGYDILSYLMTTKDKNETGGFLISDVAGAKAGSAMRYLTDTMGLSDAEAREFLDSFSSDRPEQFQFIQDTFNLGKQGLVDTRVDELSDIQSAYTGKMSDAMVQKEQAIKKSGMATGGLAKSYTDSITGLKEAAVGAQTDTKNKFTRNLGDLEFQRSEDIYGEKSDILADFYRRISEIQG